MKPAARWRFTAYFVHVLLFTLIFLTTPWGCKGNKGPIKVGFVGGLTGRLSDLGIEGRDGVILAVEEVNQAGGIRGRPVELITKDDRSDPETAVKVAEDNITNQQVALGILNKLGLHADAVGDGAEAVKALESIPYDLVLMDVQMPVMDGLEATGRIHALEAEAESSRQKEMKAQSSKQGQTRTDFQLQAFSFQLDRDPSRSSP
jgi:CheY-like chemotaxis protein